MAALLASAGCSENNRSAANTSLPAGWADTTVNTVSRPVTMAGITAVTGLRRDGSLETVVYDLRAKKRVWSQPATMVGRLAGMGVQPPAVAGKQGKSVVVAVEPRKRGKKTLALLVARDARSGSERWTRRVESTFGPAACGPYVCVSEHTARKKARFVALDPASGKQLWRMPGIAEVQWADDKTLVALRLARHPALQARSVKSGKVQWTHPIEKSVGSGVNLSGGWSFGSVAPRAGSDRSDGTLVGYIAPYQTKKGKKLSSFGFLALRLADGKPVWTRKRLLRVYPSANPAHSLLVREVDDSDRYAGFAQLDPRTGQTLTRIAATEAPKTPWWLALPQDLAALGFLSHGKAGKAYDLQRKRPLAASKLRAWSFCTVNPSPLRITGQRGFYPLAALCPFDVVQGKKLTSPDAPPAWYTGVVDGWRVWRDEKGGLHGVNDAKGTAPGMYG